MHYSPRFWQRRGPPENLCDLMSEWVEIGEGRPHSFTVSVCDARSLRGGLYKVMLLRVAHHFQAIKQDKGRCAG
jgi:hypothetical protein